MPGDSVISDEEIRRIAEDERRQNAGPGHLYFYRIGNRIESLVRQRLAERLLAHKDADWNLGLIEAARIVAGGDEQGRSGEPGGEGGQHDEA